MQKLNIHDHPFLKDLNVNPLIDSIDYSLQETGPFQTDEAYANPYKDFAVMDEIPRIVGMPDSGFLQRRKF